MAGPAKNNAFGAGSPSWNIAFPAGNLTAAEILAYLPHWLKSIDVIDRFITNGGKSSVIAAMINEFRNQPTGETFQPNSAQIMMSYAMRRAGYESWTVGTHEEWIRERALGEEDLNVKEFRPPRLTHPKGRSCRKPKEVVRNFEVEPINFKKLSLHVKKHPTGADALDLARCVQYALTHQDEDWLFPDDFESLVIHLGGPTQIDHSHLDRQAFARRDPLVQTASKASGKSNRTPKSQDMRRGRIVSQTRVKNTSSPARSAAVKTMTPQKRGNEELGKVLAGNKRRSGRLVGKSINLREEDSDATDKDIDSPYSGYVAPAKKRKLSRIPPARASTSNDSDFVQEESERDDYNPEAEEVSEEDILSPSQGRAGRAAAREARRNIQSTFLSTRAPLVLKVPGLFPSPEKKGKMSMLKLEPTPKYMTTEFNPDVKQAAKQFTDRKLVLLRPPVLSANRLRVDAASVYLYAAEGCGNMDEMWKSALSSTRFGGPRRHPPFRELHRLTDPDSMDESDWAENIRWAKEQHKAFGSTTWTEYDYHLELITEARRDTLWVSEEAINAGM